MTDREGFFTDLYTAELFFRYCKRHKVECYHDRVALLRRLVSKKKAKYLRDAESFMAGKKILRIGKKNEI